MNRIKTYFKLIIVITCLFSINSINGQFKIDSYGRFGFGTLYPNSGYRCHVAGNLLCTSYPSNPSYELRLKVGNGGSGCEIGASSDIVSFWTTEYGYNSLRASDFIKISDSTLKYEVEPLKGITSKIALMSPLKYKMEDDKIDGETGKRNKRTKVELGFFSQEINRIFPEINITTKDDNGLLLLDYDQLIPIAIAGIKEQNKRIDSLERELLEISQMVRELSNLKKSNINNESKILNCIPNPTNDETVVSFLIDDFNFIDSEIMIFNSSGQIKFLQKNSETGLVNITINKKLVGTGVFYISLFVNSIKLDTQRFAIN